MKHRQPRGGWLRSSPAFNIAPGFGRFWSARTLSLMGDYAFRIAFITHLIATTESAAVVSQATAALLVPSIVFYVFGGALGDRVRSRRAVLVVADVVRFVATAGAALTVAVTDNPLPVIGFALLVGVGSGFFEPVAFGFQTQVVPKDRLVHANSAMSVSRQLGLIVGPVAGGALVGLAGPAAAFWFDAASFALSALFVASIPGRYIAAREREDAAEERRLLRDIADGVRYVVGVRWLLVTLAAGAVANAVFAGGLDVLVPLVFTADRESGSAVRLGLFYAFEGGGALVGAVVLTRLTIRYVRGPLFGMLAVMSTSLALVGVFGRSTLSLAVAMTYGVGMHFFNSLYPALVQATVPNALVSRVSSIEFLAFDGLMPLGILLMGPLSATFGSRESLVITGLSVTAVALAVTCAPSIRALRLPAAAPRPRVAELVGDPSVP